MANQPTERIMELCRQAKKPVCSYDEMLYHFYKRYSQSEKPNRYRKYADAFRYTMSQTHPVIAAGELIVGKPAHSLSEEKAEETATQEYQKLKEAFLCEKGPDLHPVVDLQEILALGTNQLRDKIGEAAKQCGDPEKVEKDLCLMDCLESIAIFAERHFNTVANLLVPGMTKDEKTAIKRAAIAAVTVPRHPARTFHDAVQCVSFMAYCLSFDPKEPKGFKPYRLDNLDTCLLPYYEKDVKEGILSPEQAQELLDCLAVQINNRMPCDLSGGMTFGGKDNDLTAMLAKAIDHVCTAYKAAGCEACKKS